MFTVVPDDKWHALWKQECEAVCLTNWYCATPLELRCCHFDRIFVTDCTGVCYFDNFCNPQLRKFHQNDGITVSVKPVSVERLCGSHGDTYVILILDDAQTQHLMIWHEMETFSALLALCAGNSPVIGEFPSQRPVTRGFEIFFDLRLNKRLSKQSWGWWFETPSRSLWRHSND